MVQLHSQEVRLKNKGQTLRCDACQRLISKWVKDLGYTIDHNRKSYCRFCYVRLRNARKIQAKGDDSEFMNGINWELELIEQIKQKREDAKEPVHNEVRPAAAVRPNAAKKGSKCSPKLTATPENGVSLQGRDKQLSFTGVESASKKTGVCPACRSSLSFNIRGHAYAEGICPNCNSHIQLLANGMIKLVPTRASIILSVSRRTGALPDSVEEIYSYVIDEIAARLSEHPILGIPELGTFQVKKTGKQCGIEFKPSRRLVSRLATGNQVHEYDVSRLFTGTQVHGEHQVPSPNGERLEKNKI